jgi:hypothetical protein
MLKSNLIAAIQFEIRRHDWTTYMKDGIVRPGCSTCQVMINTTNQFTEHLASVIPGLIERLSEQKTTMLKSKLITATKREIQNHDLDSYRKDGINRYGCSKCDVQVGSTSQLVEHIALAIPALMNRLSEDNCAKES